MKELNFDMGLVTYSINGKCEVTFNATDLEFGERLFNAFDELDKKQDIYRAQVEKMSDKKEIFEYARKRDAEMREIIDDVFGVPVCDALFGSMNVYAMADGLPVWANLFLSVMDEIDTAAARERKATNPRIQKYMAKYKR